jgi:hypothetical protein
MMEPITIAITAADRQQAYKFAQQQLTQERSQQVYCNTLAVLVTQRFLQMLGIDTDLGASHSWNPLEQQLENIADLYIPSLQGFLECRSLRKSDRKCYIPPEVRSERLGYVMIELDEPYKEAQIVGFVQSVGVAELPRSYFQSLDILLEYLTSPPEIQPMVQLSHWLQHTFEYDWLPPKNLLDIIKSKKILFAGLGRSELESVEINPQAALVKIIQTTEDDEVRWQSAELLWELNPQHPACPVISAKDLGIYLLGHPIVLMVGILPKLDGRMLVLLRLYPLQKLSHLPPGLRLIGLDEAGNSFFAVESRQQDDYIQFKFTADASDRFSVRVVLDDASFREDFIV